MSKKIFLLCVVLFVFVSFPFVVASSEKWSQTYGGTDDEEAFSLVETADGGFVVTGYDNLFVKTDEQGNVEWTKTYEGQSLIVTSDGGFAVADSRSSDFHLIKIDASGNLEWNKTYGRTEGVEHAYSVVETPDGGYALAGYIYSYGETRFDWWLVKTDPAGNMEWNRTFAGPEFDSAKSVIVTSDGGLMVAGHRDYQSNYIYGKFWLIKTDADGNMQWNKTYRYSVDEHAECVIETADGGFAIAGSTGFWTDRTIWVVKTDTYGNVEWNRTYGDGVARGLVELSDGSYVIAGGNRLIKTDAYGGILWTSTYDAETINAVIQTSDGGYALSGTKDGNFWLAKTDEHGIIPEFPTWTTLLIMASALTILIVVYRHNLKKTKQN